MIRWCCPLAIGIIYPHLGRGIAILELGSGTFTLKNILMRGGQIVASAVEGEDGHLFLDDVEMGSS